MVIILINVIVRLNYSYLQIGYVSEEDLEEKKLLGSGGYAFAKLTEKKKKSKQVLEFLKYS
jgi:uncharacterized protein YqhQ